MIALGVNIDHVATLRQARRERVPSVRDAAEAAERGGADSITIHLREDRRHIQDADVRMLSKTVTTRLNLEMSIAKDIIAIARSVKPQQATLVPERRIELTTEGGLDVARAQRAVSRAVGQLQDAGIYVSLFIDPEIRQIDATCAAGAPCIEFHTGEYANATTQRGQHKEFSRLMKAAAYAQECGLRVNAGHGLNYTNVQRICTIPGIFELNIGFAIVARAVFVGLETAVAEMKRCIHGRDSK